MTGKKRGRGEGGVRRRSMARAHGSGDKLNTLMFFFLTRADDSGSVVLKISVSLSISP